MRSPRTYQSEAVDAIWREIVTKDLPSTIVVMATGVGKTLVEAILAENWLNVMKQRVLIISHRGTIIDQILRTTTEQAPGILVEVEKAMQFATSTSDELFGRAAQIVVASKDTLCKMTRLQRWPKDHFGMIVVDELHHAVPRKNRSYWDIFDYFASAKRVGLTATIDRADCECWRNTWHSCAYEFDTLTAVREAWLAPLQSVITHVSGLDFTNLDTVKGDFAPEQLDKLMRQESPKHGLVKPIMDYANMGGQKRKTIIFTTSVAHAHDICAIINGLDPQSAVALDGTSPEGLRTHELERYKRGEFQYLCGCDLFTEGFDEPGIRVVGIGRPTKSRAKMAQMVGRGLRALDEIVPALNEAGSADERRKIILASSKPSCLVVDAVGITGQHKLATAATVLGDGHYTDEVIERAEKNMEGKPKPSEIDQELKRAKLQLEQEAREKRARLQAAVEYSSRFVDPFDLWDVSKEVEPWWVNGMPASDKQVAVLAKLGLQKNQLEGLTVHRASRLIDESHRRKKEGLCSFAEGNLLRKFKYDPKHLTAARAKELIIQIRKNGFKPLARR